MAEQNNSDFFGEISALYGKMDKLLDKRAPDALVEREPAATPENADFPRLTEVVEAGRPRPAAQPAASLPASDELSVEVMAAIEARLHDLLARHRQEVDEAVRGIVREELAKQRGK